MHVEICDVSCILVKTVKTQKQIKYKKKKKNVFTSLFPSPPKHFPFTH